MESDGRGEIVTRQISPRSLVAAGVAACVRHAAEVEGILKSYIERAWLGQLSADRALVEAERVIRMILSESE